MKLMRYFIQMMVMANLLLSVNSAFSQNGQKIKANWQNLDLKTDSVLGISMEKAYKELLKGKKAVPVVVAVIDAGVDVNHKDLKSVIWTNSKEIPGNGKDDDGNGFIDDIHGYNFYSATVNEDDKAEMLVVQNKIKKARTDQKILDQLLQKIGKPAPSIDDFKNYIPGNQDELNIQTVMVSGLKTSPDFVSVKKAILKKKIDFYELQLTYYEKKDYDPMTGGPSSYHGTHVAGIIAAVRDNNIGINGVADHVQIMVIRTVPAGIDPVQEEPEPEIMSALGGNEDKKKDRATAEAIRYAADNGAKIINMSFGLGRVQIGASVIEAIKYAISKDVLIIHGSGNEGINLDDRNIIFPDRKTHEGQVTAASWIEVGASGWKDDENLAAIFSNYSKNIVDVYAPGVNITSTILRSTYDDYSGTSMATPVVAGLAAVIREYYPKLTAAQVKEVIIKTVVSKGALKDKCISGGVVNAYNAFSYLGNKNN